MVFAREEFIIVLGIESQRARVLQYFIIHGGRSQVWGNMSFPVIGKRGIDHCLGRGLQFVFVVIVLLVIGGC